MKKKVFVWEDVLCDYGCGLAVAIASNVEEARALLEARWGRQDDFQKNEPLVLDPSTCESIEFSVGGGS